MDVVSFSKAKKAHALAQTAQEQLHQAVANGDQLAETQQARVDSKGNPHTTLHERINAERSEINAQINAVTTQVNQSISEIELTPGPDGKSAYEIWLEQGNTGTEADFLESLKGEKGDPGSGGGSGVLVFDTQADFEMGYPDGLPFPVWIKADNAWVFRDESVEPGPDPEPEDKTPPVITISPNGGTFTEVQTVTLSANEPATIYYTLDGSEPTVSSVVHSSPITISETTTLKYFGVDSAGNESAVQTAVFTISIPEPEPDDQPILRFVSTGDWHYGMNDYDDRMNLLVDNLQNEKQKPGGLDFVIGNGDMFQEAEHQSVPDFDDSAVVLQHLKTTHIDRFGVPFYMTTGNHDRLDDATMESIMGTKRSHYFEVSDYGFILLDSSTLTGSRQVCLDHEFLEEALIELTNVKKKKAIFFFSHIPRFNGYQWGEETTDSPQCDIVMDMLEKVDNLALMASGHFHYRDGQYMYNDIPLYFHGHAAGWGVDYLGYRIYEVYKDHVVTKQWDMTNQVVKNQNTINLNPMTSVPRKPIDVGVTTRLDTSVTLGWGLLFNVDGYILRRNGTEVYRGSDLTFKDTGLSPATNYTYTLVAYNQIGESESVSLNVETSSVVEGELSVSGLQLFLDAEESQKTVTESVTLAQWNDMSGNNNHVTEQDESKRPLLLYNAYNGRNTVKFGTGKYIDVRSGFTSLTNEATIFMVLALSNPLGGKQVAIDFAKSTQESVFTIEKQSSGNYFRINNARFYVDDESYVNKHMLLAVTIGAGGTSIYADGVLIDTNATTTDFTEVVGFRVGYVFDNSHPYSDYFQGNISEIAIYDRVLNTTELDYLSSHIIQKWGIGNVPSEPPENVTNVNVSNVTTESATVSWDVSINATEYDIYIDDVFEATVTVTSYDLSGLSIGTTYTVSIRAKDIYGNTASGTEVIVETASEEDVTPPEDVANLNAMNVGETSLTLVWDASISEDVSHYNVYRGGVLQGSVEDTTYHADNLVSGTMYEFLVTVVDFSDNESNGVSITVSTTGDESPYVFMNGETDYVRTPSFAFDEVELDIVSEAAGGSESFYLDSRDAYVYPIIRRQTDGTDNFHSSGFDFVYVNDVQVTNLTTFVPSSERVKLRAVVRASRLSDNPQGGASTLFADRNNANNLKGRLYGAVFKFEGSIVAQYDFTTPIEGTTVPDISGNGNAATLQGGVWTTA